jgi:carboxypeptidase Taq
VRKRPSIPGEIARGEFAQLNAFLREAIWSQASVLPGDELMRHATGETLQPAYYEAHLRRRYLPR